MSAGKQALDRKTAGNAANARIMRRLMTAASISALIIAAPAVVISPATAEPVPAGCTDSGGNGEIDNNETITCVSASTVSEISSVLDDFDPTQHAVDLTVVIGDATTPTNVSSGSGENYGVLLGAGGSVTVYNAASTVSGFYNGISASTDIVHPYDITIISEGTISSGTGAGIRTVSAGSGDTTIDVVDVSGPGSGIRAENIHTVGGDISITSSGDITSSGGTGIRAVNDASAGSTTINVANVSGGGTTGHGIYAINDGVGLTITASGNVYGVSNGVTAYNEGSGDTGVTVSDITSVGGNGVSVLHEGADLTVSSDGTITAAYIGVGVSHSGTGATTITVDAIDASTTGISALVDSTATGDVNITANGDIDAGSFGIALGSLASGDTTINVGNVRAGSSSTADGLNVSHAGEDLTITAASMTEISASQHGVNVDFRGSGNADISLYNIDAVLDGIVVETAATTTGDVSVAATGAITAGRNGVVLNHDGTGAASLSLNTLDAGSTGVIMNAAAAATGDVSLTATGAITAGGEAIVIDNYGAGSVMVDVVDVDAGPGFLHDGIDVENDGADIDIISTGIIDAGSLGVSAINRGTGATRISVHDVTAVNEAVRIQSAASTTGDVSVTATGALTSANRYGVYVNQQGSGAVSVSVNDVTADDEGVRVFAEGGDIDVAATGTVMADITGVRASTDAAGAIDIAVNAVNTSNRAIDAYNAGGDISVTATGAITAQNDAIVLEQYNNASVTGVDGISVDVDSVTAGVRAISVTSSAFITGDVSVTATGLIDAGRRAIVINNRGAGDTGVYVGDVTAGAGASDIGVQVSHLGNDLTIVSTGSISAGGAGVFADHRGTGDMAITVNSIDAGVFGINAVFNDPAATGDLTIAAYGQINAGTSGVSAWNIGTGGINVSVDAVDAGVHAVGIYAATGGTGDVSLTATGALTTQDDDAVLIYQYGGGDTTINVVDVATLDMDSAALDITHRGGALSVTSTGVISSAGYGVKAYNTGTGDTTISVGSVAADYGAGILAQNENAGALSITATGLVSAQAIDGDYAGVGIWADAQAGGDITVDAADVYGQTYGVHVQSTGGAVNVTAEDVSGYYYDAVHVIQSSGAGNVSVTTTGAVTSDEGRGVFVSNNGTGATAVNVNSVESAYGGVRAYSSASAVGSDVTVTASGAIEAGDYGIFVDNAGYGGVNVSASDIDAGVRGVLAVAFSGSTGDMNVTTSGAVVAQDRNAIGVFNMGSGDTVIDINDATAVSAYAALSVVHHGGELSVNAAGTLTSGGDGVTVFSLGTDATTINVNNINAEDNALEITQSAGGGAVSVTATGTVAAANGDGVGVLRDGPSLADVTISVANVTGGNRGVFAMNDNGAVNVTVAGAVMGEGGYGILSVAPSGSAITIDDGGSVTGVGAALRTEGDGSDVLSLNSGGSIVGDALLLAGDDTFNDAGGAFTTIFGGDGTDTVNFEAGGERTINGSGGAADGLQEFEIFNFNASGVTLAGAHTGLSEANFNAGTNTLTGTLTSGQTTVAAGATLNKADGSAINGALTVNGTLSIGNSPGVSFVDGDVVFGPTSVLPIETLGDDHDTLIVTGSVTLDGELQIIHLGDLGVGTTRRTIIDADREIVGSHATVTSEQGLLISNSVDLDPSGFDLILTTTVNSALSVDGLTDDELSVGEHLIELLAQPSLDPELAGLINAVGAIPGVGDLNAALAELHPEGFDGGLRYAANSQGRFMSSVIDGSAHAARRAGPDGAHVWAAVDLSRLQRKEEPRHVGFEGDAYEFSAGISDVGRGPLRFGFAGGYARFEGDTKAGLTDAIDVSLYRLAASARMTMDGAGANGHIDNVASFAKGENELAMRLIDPVSDAQITQSGEADITSIGFATRFTVTGVNGRDWPVRPHAEIGVDAIRQDAVDLRAIGSGATALAVDKLDSTRAHIALGAAFDHSVNSVLSLNASVEGVRYFGDTENVIEARFAAAPENVPAFRTIGANVEWQARMRAGASYEHKSGFVLSADAFGEAGDLSVYGARLELSRRF